MIKPKLPKVGDKVTILGIDAVVREVWPQGDWGWGVELSSLSLMGGAQLWSIELPTDFRTGDGLSVRDA